MTRPPFLRALAKKNHTQPGASSARPQPAHDVPQWPPAAPTGTAPSQAPTVPLRRIVVEESAAPTSPPPQARLRVDNLSVAMPGQPPVNHVSFEATAGRIRSIVGPVSGGVEPLAAALAGVIRSSSGSISVDVTPRRNAPSEWSMADWWADACADNSTLRLIDQLGRTLGGASQRRLAHVPLRAECAWNYPASVNDIVVTAQWARHQWWRRPRRTDYLAAADALDRVGLLPWAGRDIRTLDPTQQQLLLIARGIVSSPAAVILHRPTEGLDAAGRETIGDVVRALADEGEALVILTDDAPFAVSCSDDITLLHCGVIAQGEVAAVRDLRLWERTFRVTAGSDLILSVRGMLNGLAPTSDDAPPPPREASGQGESDLPVTETSVPTAASSAPSLPHAAPSVPAADSYPWLRPSTTQPETQAYEPPLRRDQPRGEQP